MVIVIMRSYGHHEVDFIKDHDQHRGCSGDAEADVEAELLMKTKKCLVVAIDNDELMTLDQ